MPMRAKMRVPMDTPGLRVLRNTPVLHHLAPEGHCEILLTAWRLDQSDSDPQQPDSDVASVKVVAAQLPTLLVDRAMHMFGAMGLSPDTPLAYFWSWGRDMHLMDGPDEVHLRSIARQALR